MRHKDELEVIYYFSGSLMLLGVAVGWLQLYYIRRDLKAKYRRDSIREVFNSLEGFAQASDMSYELDILLDNDGLFDDRPDINGFNYSDFPEGCSWLKRFENSAASYDYAVDFLNFVEPMSQRILSGLADERYAYRIEGSFFLNLINKQRTVIAAHRALGHEDTFKDSIELYELWRNRRAREEARAKLLSEIRIFLRMPKDKVRKTIQ